MQTLEQAQETNKRLNRRLQELEGPWQSKVQTLEFQVSHLRRQWMSDFNRLLRAHAELKECYVAAAKITGAPHAAFHSVMDGCKGWGENPDHVFANAYVANGVETIRVVDEVKRALAGKRRPTWWERTKSCLSSSQDKPR